MKIISETKLPIYQKLSMAYRTTAASVDMLNLNSLENPQQVSELYPYDALNLLSCMTLDVKNI